MRWQAAVRKVLGKFGYNIERTDWSPVARRMRLIEYYDINLVLDVGANEGQYAVQLREHGYRGDIVSFEPLSDASAILQARAHADPKWQVVPLALGDADGETVIRVSAKNENSSLLPLTVFFETLNPAARVTHEQTTGVRRLDSIAAEYIPMDANVFLKMDTQGFEAHVLRGATKTLDRVCGVQMEMSVTPLYQGETGMLGLLQIMTDRGFTLMSTEQVYNDAHTGRQYQFDAIFFREPVP